MDYSLLVDTFRRARADGKLPQQRLLYECLRAAILDGTLAPKARLPASRALADELRMARNSVLYAYERLADEGFVRATRHGTQVAAVDLAPVQRVAAPSARAITLSRRVSGLQRERGLADENAAFVSGVPALDHFPLAQWRGCVERGWRTAEARDLGYGNAEGYPGLRRAIAEYLRVSRGVRCTLEQVFITDGTQISLDLCARLLADPDDYAWLENPGYNGARAAFRAAGLRVVPVPVDADGCAAPPSLWHERPPKLVYITPSHQYPLGSILSLERRLQLIEDAQAAGAWIIEDDYDSEFRRDGPPLSAVQGLTRDAPVIYLGTFSKTLFPALRLGYMAVPAELAGPVTAALGEIARRGRRVEQIALAEFIESGAFALHLRRMRRLYAQRRDALLDALYHHTRDLLTVSGGAGGMHLSARLDMPLSDRAVSQAALQYGMVLQPISGYCALPDEETAADGVAPNAGFNGFVLGYAGVPAARMDEHVRTLARVIHSQAKTDGKSPVGGMDDGRS